MNNGTQPTEADYAISTLAQDLAQALAEKASYLGKLTVAERTNQLLVQENQGLREKLEAYQQDAQKAEPEPTPDASADRPSRSRGK